MTHTEHPFLKMAAAWLAVIAGWQITHWAALAALIYTVLQTYLLIRDKIIRDQKDHK